MQGDICPLSMASGNALACNNRCKFRAENGDCKLAELINNLQLLTARKARS